MEHLNPENVQPLHSENKDLKLNCLESFEHIEIMQNIVFFIVGNIKKAEDPSANAPSLTND